MENKKKKETRLKKKAKDRKHKPNTQLPQLVEASKQLITNLAKPSLPLPDSQFLEFLKNCYTNQLFDNHLEFLVNRTKPNNTDLEEILGAINEKLTQENRYSINESFKQALEHAKSVIEAYQKKEQVFSALLTPSVTSISSSSSSMSPSSSIPSLSGPSDLDYTLLSLKLKNSANIIQPDEHFKVLMAICKQYALLDLNSLLTIDLIQQKVKIALQTANDKLNKAKIPSDLRDEILRNLAINLYQIEQNNSLGVEIKMSAKQPGEVKHKLASAVASLNDFIKAHDKPLKKPVNEAVKTTELKYVKLTLPRLLNQFLTNCHSIGLLEKIPESLSTDEISICLQRIRINILAEPLYHAGKNHIQFDYFFENAIKITELYQALPDYDLYVETTRKYSSFLIKLYEYNTSILAIINNLKDKKEEKAAKGDKEAKYSSISDKSIPLLQACLKSCKENKLMTFEFDDKKTSLTKEYLQKLSSKLVETETAEASKKFVIILPVCEQIKQLFKNYLYLSDLSALPDTCWRSVTVKIDEFTQALQEQHESNKNYFSESSRALLSKTYHEFTGFCSGELIPLGLEMAFIEVNYAAQVTVALPRFLQKLQEQHDHRYAMLIASLENIMNIIGQIRPNIFKKEPSSFSGISSSLSLGNHSPAPQPVPLTQHSSTSSPPISPPSITSLTTHTHSPLNTVSTSPKPQRKGKVEVDTSSTPKRENPWSPTKK